MGSPTTAFSEGLQEAVAAESSICLIDGKNSKLAYRGYDIHDLAAHAGFEETAYLLHFGRFPRQEELAGFNRGLASQRELPKELVRHLELFPKAAHPMAALRSAVSLLSHYDPEPEDLSAEANARKAQRLLARVPTVVAYVERLRKGLPLATPKLDGAVGTAANFLYMLRGEEASPAEIRTLDRYFILLAEHDLNASTFAARIAASTLSDIYSAVTSAVGTLKGDLHGSAAGRAMESLIEIGDVSRVDACVDGTIRDKRKFMGFGHRVYKGPDPRATDLKRMAAELARSSPAQAKWYAISEKLEAAVWEKKKLHCNVDFYSASILYSLGIPVDLFASVFAIGRTAGWTAHVLEQYARNRLLRPLSAYSGPASQAYVPIEKR